MKKKILTLLCAVMCLMCIVGCGTIKEIDLNSLCGEIMSANIFDEDLTQVKTSVTLKRLSIQETDVEECIAYAGTKAVVDEVVLVKATSPEAAQNVVASLDKHIALQQKSYASYRSEEVPKLDSAVSVSEGNYVMLVVSNDSAKAEEIVNSYIK